MSRTELILLALGAVVLVAILLAARGSGPRVTTIETRREPRDDQEK